MRKTIPIILVMLFISATLWAQAENKPATEQPSPPKASLLNPSSMTEQAPAVFKAKFTTTKGDFVVEDTRA